MTTAQLHQRFLQCSQACTDSRNITENAMFFALKGDNFNGNTFASEALKKGARFAVVDEEAYAVHNHILLVDDVLKSLQELSSFHRNYCGTKVVALTGSNGKTTTKELIFAVLSKKYRTMATRGNLNNHIGVPLTLLSLSRETEMAVVEMGANHKGEIRQLCAIAQPDFGYITNYGKAHLEGFGGIKGVIEGKSELYDFLIKNKRQIFYNADDPIQVERLGNYPKKLGFSLAAGSDAHIPFIGANPFVRMEFGGETIGTQLVGSYNFNNCAAAALIGQYFGVPAPAVKAALESYIPSNNRSQLIDKSGYRILLDAYNANPSSMKAALDNFELMEGREKTVFLGDMFELGSTSPEEHQQIADLVAAKGFQQVYLIGENFSGVQTALKTFKGYPEFEAFIKKHKPPVGNILIKGSRGMALERVLDSL